MDPQAPYLLQKYFNTYEKVLQHLKLFCKSVNLKCWKIETYVSTFVRKQFPKSDNNKKEQQKMTRGQKPKNKNKN